MRFELAVVGGGPGGLAAARAGARRGRRTAIVQDGRLGGDCTFTGCVPSKTLIESAARRRSFAETVAMLHEVVELIAATEDVEALAREGIEVIEGRARFSAPRVLSVGDRTVRAERVVIATGSCPSAPPIPGLAEVPYLTNETIFDLDELPKSLAVIGGGPIGCELAQAFRRFGAEVRLIEAENRLLPREEPEAGDVIGKVFADEGIDLHLYAKVTGIASLPAGTGVSLALADGSNVEAEKLLVCAGRRPITDGLDPGAGGVDLDERGYVRTDRHLRTTARDTYAVGDVTGRLLFTHAADEMGRLAVRNAFRPMGRSAFDTSAIPWVTFTDPEVARVGLSEVDAAAKGAKIAFLPMTAVDRAVTAGRTEGFVKLVAGPRPVLRSAGGGAILGATVVAPRAGEMIHEVALAMRTGMFTGRLAQAVHAYPTWSTAVRQAAAQFFIDVDGRRARPARAR
ncbi:MAG: dihydrolipoyl dehydrogenase family protein [Acidimicrobiales bacterium]